MKYIVKYTKQFERDLKLLDKQGVNLNEIGIVIDTISNGQVLPLKYRDHMLKGKYNRCHECHIKPDLLLIWKYIDDVLVVSMLRTGSHSRLFNK